MSDAKERVEYRLRISLNEGKALDDALVSIAEEWQADKDELARLRKAIEKHRDAEGGGIHTYSWYDKELYKALAAIEAAMKEKA